MYETKAAKKKSGNCMNNFISQRYEFHEYLQNMEKEIKLENFSIKITFVIDEL
jgi:hypothetical protein